MTKGQALWYDEGEYLIRARHLVTGLPETGYWWGRPPLFTWITSVFFLFGTVGGEFLTRAFLAAAGVGSVWVMFLLGKELFNSEEVGLLSSVFVSASWILLFLSFRILVEVPLFFLMLLSALWFVRYDKTGLVKWFWLAFLGAGLSFLMKWTAGMLLVIFPVYLLLKHRMRLARMKHERWLFVAVLAAAVGYVWYSLKKSGGLLYVFEKIGLFTLSPGELSGVISQQIGFVQGFVGSIWLWVIAAALVWALSIVLLHYGVIFKRQKTRALAILLLWSGLFFAAFVFIKAWENRYVIPLLIPFYLLTAVLAVDVARRLPEYRQMAIGVIVVLLLVGSYGQFQQGNALIQEKFTGYRELQEAGQWIQEHSERGDIILSAGRPQLTHYTELENLQHTYNLTSELALIREHQVKYSVISNWEKSPEWLYEYLLGGQGEEYFVPVFQSVRDYGGGRRMFAVVFETTELARQSPSMNNQTRMMS